MIISRANNPLQITELTYEEKTLVSTVTAGLCEYILFYVCCAIKLEGCVFDTYMRLSTHKKQDVRKLELELLKEFEKGKQYRETASQELNNRKQHQGESALTFA